MAFTKVSEIESFDEGMGIIANGSPKYWPEDILLLINTEDPKHLVERNIIFQGQEISGLMGSDTKNTDLDNIVLLRCPPYARPLVEHFKN